MNVLSIKNLTVSFQKPVVRGISFHVMTGEIVGVVGESGSGKSMTALSLMNLLPEEAHKQVEEFEFDGEKREPMLGKEISMIFQEPMTSLNPSLSVGNQVEEKLKIHETLTRRERKKRVKEMFRLVGLEDSDRFYRKYPHELSGGMQQRVMIAQAVICRPKLLIADEPTTALDVMVQEQILSLLTSLSKQMQMSILFISHDIKLVHRFCHHVLVMRDGEIVEHGSGEAVFYSPRENYTKKLVDALPNRDKHEPNHVLTDKTVLKAENIAFSYGTKNILHGIDFELKQGEILGIMGRSGCGKSTLCQIITGLRKQDEGNVIYEGKPPRIVFQNPYGSLNPAKTVEWILEEPLKLMGTKNKQERKQRVQEMLHAVQLDKSYVGARIQKLSGGQRQRVAIACALITYPDIIVLDEPVSALDVTVQDKICKLLLSCKEKYHLSYIFISHDKDVLEMMCDRILTMKNGVVTE